MATDSDKRIYAIIDYEDPYVQPLILAALKSRLPPDLLVFIKDLSELPSPTTPLLQWRQYEQLNFDHLLFHTRTSLANSYIIRKALIRKHYLSNTVRHWLAKHPESVLGGSVPPCVELEVDYAEFLDDALVEAWELKASWARRAVEEGGEREWWILKPGMSERGEGIRLFSSEEELQAIFDSFETPSSDDEDGDVGEVVATNISAEERTTLYTSGVMTSQMRHFIAQPYIHPPLLLDAPHPAAGRKFHIRTYVLAVGALKVYVYRGMLALFAGKAYTAPGEDANLDLDRHLTNTCLQDDDSSNIYDFWSLPSSVAGLQKEWQTSTFTQISAITCEIFLAAARTSVVHFQPLSNSFEIFGVDFLVDAGGKCWLLEVNAFPDLAQTGEELRGVVEGLVEGVVEVGVKGFFGLGELSKEENEEMGMVRVLDLDLGRR